MESEQARLEALHSLTILDTPPEERFDRITRLATHLFGVDVALVSLVDEQRQWFKSRQGFGLTQTCRRESFCAHAIQGDDIFEIEDASKDSRFSDNPLVTVSQGIRFYAGVPLKTSSGFRVGTLCIIDARPRRLDGLQRQALVDLAACAEEEMNRGGLERELAKISEARIRLSEEEYRQRLLVAALSSLNEISTSNGMSFAEQLESALDLGCRYFQMQIGIVSRIDSDLFKIVSIQAPHDITLNAGQCLPLANTYCDMVLASDGFLAIHNVGQSHARDHACYTTFGLEAYIGSAIYVGEQLFGTVSFSSSTPRELAFAETDKLFLKLLNRWIGASLERQRIETLKNEFISTVSHELRTPLTAVIGGIKLVHGGATGEVSEQARHMLNIALKNSERLGVLINDLLDMEKLLAGQLSFISQPHLLHALLTASVQENQPYAHQYGVSLKLIPLPMDWWVNVDPVRFQQIMANLLSNAAKFSKPESEVTIFCETKDHHVRINVQDNGCGIPSGFRRRIFEKFSQADASDCRVKGGTGLGLSMSKALTEQMGGDIGYTSREGAGSNFYIVFPLAEVADHATS